MKISSWEELIKIRNSSNGFIFNDFGTISNWDIRNNNKLHKSSCYQLKQFTPDSTEWTYHFDTFNEAINWLKSNRKKQGYINCNTCLKDINLE